MIDDSTVARVFRHEHARAVAVLIRAFGDIDVAEEAVQEAFAVALERWPEQGLPPRPAGWIITTARNRAIDRLRRESIRLSKHIQAALLHPNETEEVDTPVEDDRLRLIFTCCHPALAPGARVALTLRLIGGLTTAEIARGLLTSESAVAQRLVRAKAKIRDARIPYRLPSAADLPDRLPDVLAVVYLIYNEGHLATGPELATRPDLASEAVRLARLLADLMPDEPEVIGLLALLVLGESRRPARFTVEGDLVLLADQDRRRWDRDLIREGQSLVRRCLRRGSPGPYQIQAAIAAVHSSAPDFASTDWAQILSLYDQLLAVDPSPVVALNRAVALAEAGGVEEALGIVEDLDLKRNHSYHAVRGELLFRLGRNLEAADSFAAAMELATNTAELNLLSKRRSRCLAESLRLT